MRIKRDINGYWDRNADIITAELILPPGTIERCESAIRQTGIYSDWRELAMDGCRALFFTVKESSSETLWTFRNKLRNRYNILSEPAEMDIPQTFYTEMRSLGTEGFECYNIEYGLLLRLHRLEAMLDRDNELFSKTSELLSKILIEELEYSNR